MGYKAEETILFNKGSNVRIRLLYFYKFIKFDLKYDKY